MESPLRSDLTKVSLLVFSLALFVHCAVDVITQSGNYVRSHVGRWPELTPGWPWLKFMLSSFHCPVCALTVVRREAHEQYGLYDPSYGFVADVEMWMRLSRHGDVAYVREPLVQIRERDRRHEAVEDGICMIGTIARIHRSYVPHNEQIKRSVGDSRFPPSYVGRKTCTSHGRDTLRSTHPWNPVSPR